MRHGQQVPSETKNDGHAGGGLHAAAVEATPKIVRNGQRAAASQVAAKEQRPVDVAHRRHGRPEHPSPGMSFVGDPGIRQKCGSAEIAGHKCADDHDRWCLTSGDKVVFEVLDLAPGIVAHRNVDEDADQDAGGVDVDVSFFLF